ncbi:hypothetical protein BRADI_4g09963v3 [Brachypodium distachyon]|uniref:Uncharacterized protein n=1 Tax=Brachypodium distachyon TaxID=15368 RepID=A0A2K2CLQ5_BRADI|nr:hypothetical protein BRADI_4g09963v3 [Brachypodium distachyon]
MSEEGSEEQLFLEEAEGQLLLEEAAHEEGAQGATSQTTQSKSKRGANKVPTESWVVIKLSKENYPEEPVEAAERFSNTCNAIVRVRARIYQRWSDVPEAVKQDCYEVAWKRFVPANDEIRRRLEWRMHQVMRKGQSTWQYNCRKLIGKDWKTEVNKHWKGISEEDWERFKEWVRSNEFKASQKWYKELREKRPFDHRLGSCGRPGKEKVWAKEDAALDQAGIQPRVPTLLRVPDPAPRLPFVQSNSLPRTLTSHARRRISLLRASLAAPTRPRPRPGRRISLHAPAPPPASRPPSAPATASRPLAPTLERTPSLQPRRMTGQIVQKFPEHNDLCPNGIYITIGIFREVSTCFLKDTIGYNHFLLQVHLN